MRTKLIIAAILVQFLVLAWMAGEREWIVRTGPCVWLRTAPVDPRDLMRGDYVRLGYEISTIPEGKFGPGLKKHLAELAMPDGYDRPSGGRSEMVIYSVLEVHPETGLAELATADLTPPPSGLFIKGRAHLYAGDALSHINGVAYGIDAFYVQQGKGYEIERGMREARRNSGRAPMEMQVALGRNGTAVLKDYRWRTP